MRKGIAIFLLSIMVFTGTEAKQLLKLPFLVEHYISHKELNIDLTLAEFIKMHYAKDVKIDDDFAEDMKLPFKMHPEFSTNYFVATPPQFNNEVEQYIYLPVRKFPVTNSAGNILVSLANIWQPPKSC